MAERFLKILRLLGMANPNEVMALAQETPRLLTLSQTGWSSLHQGVEAKVWDVSYT